MQLTNMLGDKIKNSPLYLEYFDLKQKLYQDTAKKSRVYEFKKKQIEIEVRKTSGEAVSDEEEASLNDLYTELMVDTVCAGYMEKERALIRLLSSVFNTIEQKAPIDLEYMV